MERRGKERFHAVLQDNYWIINNRINHRGLQVPNIWRRDGHFLHIHFVYIRFCFSCMFSNAHTCKLYDDWRQKQTTFQSLDCWPPRSLCFQGNFFTSGNFLPNLLEHKHPPTIKQLHRYFPMTSPAVVVFHIGQMMKSSTCVAIFLAGQSEAEKWTEPQRSLQASECPLQWSMWCHPPLLITPQHTGQAHTDMSHRRRLHLQLHWGTSSTRLTSRCR